MYSNNRGFNLVDILIKIVFFIVFIFVLVYLFPQVSDLNPFYNNIFRENIKYMQDAAEDYFNDNLPSEIGDTSKLTLKQMIEQNLLIPFVDKENNSCNLYKSYAEITKSKEGYKLRINLVCNGESDYIEKTLGCNNYCDGVNCKNLKDACKNCDTPEEKTCTESKNITYYQFEKQSTIFSTSYYCEEGYSLKDKTCYRTVQGNREKAIPVYDEDRTIIEDAKKIQGSSYREYVDSTMTEETQQVSESKRVELALITTFVPAGRVTVNVPCTKYRSEQSCTTTTTTESYSCDCKNVISGGRVSTVCGTCTRSVPVQSCSTSSEPYTGTCPETKYTEEHYEYTCPEGTDSEVGEGINKKCYDYQQVTKEIKVKKYTCPSDVDGSIGNGEDLQCYYLKYTPVTYKCENKDAVRVGSLCYITEPGAFRGYRCKTSAYKLDGDYCYLEAHEEKAANANTSSSFEWLQEWSTSSFLEGWRRTGLTKTVATTVNVPCK